MTAPPSALNESPKKGNLGTYLQKYREFSVVAVLAIICILLYFSPAKDTFYTSGNMQNLLLQIALLSTFAIGETIVILTGGIDLSLGSLVGFGGMVLAWTAVALNGRLYIGAAVGLAILATLVVTFFIGSIHSSLIHKLKLPPFVVTLASLTIFRSQALLMNKQLPISVSDFPFLTNLANGQFLGIPLPVYIVGVIAVAMHLILSYTKTGRYVYSVGSNEQATQLSGINISRVKLFAYGTSAVLAGVAGILYAGYGGQGDPQSGGGYELDAVAAAVIGGANLRGGQGTVAGTLLGACLLKVILSGINLTISNPSLWEGSVVGGVLLLAVLVSAFQQRKQKYSS